MSASQQHANGPLASLPPICHALLEAKAKKGELWRPSFRFRLPDLFGSGMTFEQIAKEIGRPEVWTAALFYGQAKVSRAGDEHRMEAFDQANNGNRSRRIGEGCLPALQSEQV